MWSLGSRWCGLLNHVYIHSFTSIIEATEKLKQQPRNFPGGGGISLPEMDLCPDEAFEQLFGPGKRGGGGGDFNKNFPKIQMPGGLPWGWGDVEASL